MAAKAKIKNGGNVGNAPKTKQNKTNTRNRVIFFDER